MEYNLSSDPSFIFKNLHISSDDSNKVAYFNSFNFNFINKFFNYYMNLIIFLSKLKKFLYNPSKHNRYYNWLINF